MLEVENTMFYFGAMNEKYINVITYVKIIKFFACYKYSSDFF